MCAIERQKGTTKSSETHDIFGFVRGGQQLRLYPKLIS